MSFVTMFDPIFMLLEDDIQGVARHRLHRYLTDEELHVATHAFTEGMDGWWDIAVSAVDKAVAKQR